MTTRDAILDYLGAQHRRGIRTGSSLNAVQKGAKLRLGGNCPPIHSVIAILDDLLVEQRVVTMESWNRGQLYRLRLAGDA